MPFTNDMFRDAKAKAQAGINAAGPDRTGGLLDGQGGYGADRIAQAAAAQRQAAAPPAAPAAPDPYSLQGEGAGELEAQRQREALQAPSSFETLAPGQGQEFLYDNLRGSAGMMGGANPTAQAYQDFQANRPDLMQDANLGSYYDNAQRQMLEGINQNAAARGAYGSSAALAEGNEGIMNLRAQQANREADYQLQRAAEQRAWEQAGGQLAAGQSGAQNMWAQTLGNQALGADRQRGELAAAQNQAAMNRMGQGMQGARDEQALREGRIGNMLNERFRREALYLPQVNTFQQGTFGGDEALFAAGEGGDVAEATAGAAIDERNKTQLTSELGAAANIYSGLGGPSPFGGS